MVVNGNMSLQSVLNLADFLFLAYRLLSAQIVFSNIFSKSNKDHLIFFLVHSESLTMKLDLSQNRILSL